MLKYFIEQQCCNDMACRLWVVYITVTDVDRKTDTTAIPDNCFEFLIFFFLWWPKSMPVHRSVSSFISSPMIMVHVSHNLVKDLYYRREVLCSKSRLLEDFVVRSLSGKSFLLFCGYFFFLNKPDKWWWLGVQTPNMHIRLLSTYCCSMIWVGVTLVWSASAALNP